MSAERTGLILRIALLITLHRRWFKKSSVVSQYHIKMRESTADNFWSISTSLIEQPSIINNASVKWWNGYFTVSGMYQLHACLFINWWIYCLTNQYLLFIYAFCQLFWFSSFAHICFENSWLVSSVNHQLTSTDKHPPWHTDLKPTNLCFTHIKISNM